MSFTSSVENYQIFVLSWVQIQFFKVLICNLISNLSISKKPFWIWNKILLQKNPIKWEFSYFRFPILGFFCRCATKRRLMMMTMAYFSTENSKLFKKWNCEILQLGSYEVCSPCFRYFALLNKFQPSTISTSLYSFQL